jgi:hypothetical protein
MKEILKCFECKKKTKNLIRFMCYKCYQHKFYKKKLSVKPNLKTNWICDCPTNDLRKFNERICMVCRDMKPVRID